MSITLQIINSDIPHSSATGRPMTIANDAALKQAIICNLETATRNNGFGAGIQDLVGVVASDDDSMSMLLQLKLINSFDVMKSLQILPPAGHRPDNEKLQSVIVLQSSRNNADPRRFDYSVNVTTLAGATLRVSGTLSQGS